MAGSVDANADATQDPRFRVTLFITAPPVAASPAPTQKVATTVRMLITWPALADPQASTTPGKFSGSYEVVIALNRN